MENILEKAIAVAAMAHAGVLDKGGKPYIFHPLRVSMSPLLETNEERAVAVLHDVVEDTDVKVVDLLEFGFPGHVVDAVLSVTKVEGETYMEFIKRASKNPIGTKVKLADIEDNTREDRLSYLEEEHQAYLRKKYGKAKKFLLDN